METVEQPNWESHASGKDCEKCSRGYPHPCACGGRIHGEIVAVKNDGFVQLTRCDKCGEPEIP